MANSPLPSPKGETKAGSGFPAAAETEGVGLFCILKIIAYIRVLKSKKTVYEKLYYTAPLFGYVYFSPYFIGLQKRYQNQC